MINKWASWCRPCRAEFPIFQRVATDRGKDVAFIGVNAKDMRPAAERFLADFPVPFPSYEDADEDIARELRAGTNFPMTVFVDARGKTEFVHAGRVHVGGRARRRHRQVPRRVNELRVDPLTGLKSIIAAGRATRPGGGFHVEPPDPIDPATDPFAHGHEDQTPPEVHALRPGRRPRTARAGPCASSRTCYPALTPDAVEPEPARQPRPVHRAGPRAAITR